jgi:hypothetical protein
LGQEIGHARILPGGTGTLPPRAREDQPSGSVRS